MSIKTKQWRNGVNAGTSSAGVVVTLGEILSLINSVIRIWSFHCIDWIRSLDPKSKRICREYDSTGFNVGSPRVISPRASAAKHSHPSSKVWSWFVWNIISNQIIQVVDHVCCSTGYFPTVAEDIRKEYAENVELLKTMTEIRTVFGLITKQSDAIRTIQAVSAVAGVEQISPLLVSEGLISSAELDKANNIHLSSNVAANTTTTVSSQNKMKIVNTSIEVAVLVRHIKVTID